MPGPRKPAGPTLVLIGLRASGKSTLGGRLADRLCREFLDLDNLVARSMDAADAGQAIRTHGLEVFRQHETRALEQALAGPPAAVLSLGGGTPTAPGAQQLLLDAVERGACAACYLRAQAETLVERLTRTDTATRPSLTGSGTTNEVEQLFNERDGLYQRLAGRVIETDGLDEDSVLERLVGWATTQTDQG